jgi:hypothetical protein
MNCVILWASIKKSLKFSGPGSWRDRHFRRGGWVACSCLSAGLEMVVLSIAQPYEILQNFLLKSSPENLATVIRIQAKVSHRNRWNPWNRLLVLAFHAVT